MKEFTIKNSNEKFTFFTNEENNFSIIVKSLMFNETLANIIISKEDVYDIKTFIEKVYNNLDE